MRKQGGFTLIELLVVILILAILMAIALPLYLRAVRDSNRQTCRSNMQTIANALQAFRVRDVDHWYPGLAAGTAGTIDFAAENFLDPTSDLAALPQCPTDSVAGDADDYTATVDDNGQLTIMCNSDSATEAAFHNDIDGDLTTAEGFRPGVDAQ
jgi:type IV pilus assembly protein PilA